MSSITTQTGICNISLGWLRANLIVNFDTDESVEAKLCRANYDRMREAVLEDREWRFATKRVSLLADIEVPEYGWLHRFKLPSDTIRALACAAMKATPLNNSAMDNNIEWEREEDFIKADRSQIFLRYTMNIEEPTKFSPGFVQSLATRLAAELAVPLTGSDKRHDSLMAQYVAMVDRAGTRDGMQGKARKRRPGRLQQARYRGGGGFETLGTDV